MLIRGVPPYLAVQESPFFFVAYAKTGAVSDITIPFTYHQVPSDTNVIVVPTSGRSTVIRSSLVASAYTASTSIPAPPISWSWNTTPPAKSSSVAA